MTEQAKNRLGTIAAILVIVISIIILVGFSYGATSLLWILSITNLISGPTCFILYLREVRKGVFEDKEKNLKIS